MNKYKILCLIPARSGSKGIPHKNIKKLGGIPLLNWSINQAKSCKYANCIRIIVSTDSEEYAEIAKKGGAEVPFLRPESISADLSTDYEFISHSLSFLRENEKYIPDIVLQLRPTQPLRKVSDIDKCLDIFIENYDEYDSLRTVVPFEKSPFKMYTIKDNQLTPLFNEVNKIKEPYNQCRQILPQTFLHNGYIDIIKASIIKDGVLSGEKIYAYLMDKNDTIDIDTLEDWEKAEKIALSLSNK